MITLEILCSLNCSWYFIVLGTTTLPIGLFKAVFCLAFGVFIHSVFAGSSNWSYRVAARLSSALHCPMRAGPAWGSSLTLSSALSHADISLSPCRFLFRAARCLRSSGFSHLLWNFRFNSLEQRLFPLYSNSFCLKLCLCMAIYFKDFKRIFPHTHQITCWWNHSCIWLFYLIKHMDFQNICGTQS